MVWALITRLPDLLACIGLGTVLWFTITVTRKLSRRNSAAR